MENFISANLTIQPMLEKISAYFSVLILSSSAALGSQLNRAEILFCRGMSRFGNFDYARAIADFTEAIRINPRYAEAYFYRGTAFYARGLSRVHNVAQDRRDFTASNANYNQALRLGYSYRYLIFLNRGNARGNLGDYRGAIADLTQGIELSPYYAASHYERRALAYLYLGNRRAAANDFNQAANLYKRQMMNEDRQLARNRAESVLTGKVTPRQLGISWIAITSSGAETKCP